MYIKTIPCGCIIETLVFGINKENKYLLGSHQHLFICEKCKRKQSEQKSKDLLFFMWKNDYLTDDFGYGGWKKKK